VFVRSYTHAGSHRWTRQFGTSADDHGFGVAVGASAVYVVGHTGGTLPGQTRQGGDDVFVRKYDHAGQYQWTRQFGTSVNDEGSGVAVHTSGVYVVGSTEGTLPGQTTRDGWDVFVRSYTHAGSHRWTRQFGSSADEAGYGVAVQTDTHYTASVYIVGYTRGAFPGQNQEGLSDVFLRAYTCDGGFRWTRQFGTSADDEGWGVGVHASGVYVVGDTRGALSGKTYQGGSDVFLRKYDRGGEHQWTRQFGTSADEVGYGVAVNDSGVYVVGTTWGALPVQTHWGSADVFVRAYTKAGAHRWTRQFGTSDDDFGLGLAADASAVWVVGSTWGKVGLTHWGRDDVFLRKYATV
jgi:hypothetical protein